MSAERGLDFDYPSGRSTSGVSPRRRPRNGSPAPDEGPLSVDWPIGTSVGARWFGASGIPRTRQAASFRDPGNVQGAQQRRAICRFSVSSTCTCSTRSGLSGRFRLTLSANTINLLNQGTATNYYANELFLGQNIALDEVGFFNGGIDTQAAIAQQRLDRDARFMMDSATSRRAR